MTVIAGLQDVTAICAEPRTNLDFFTGTLGQRLVIPTRLTDDFLDLRVETERPDALGVVGDGVPNEAAGVDDGVAALEDAER